MRGTVAAKLAAAVLLFALALVPTAHGQAAAGAVAGNAGAFAGAGFPFNFPFFNPFPVAPLCTPGWTVNPWEPPGKITNPNASLLSTVNGKPVFSDVTLCCGSSITFAWPAGQTHGIWQLASGACPATFTNTATAGQRQLFPASSTATTQVLTLGTPGTYWFTSQQGQDCAQGQIIKVTVPAGTCGTSATSTAPGGEQRTSAGPGSQASAAGSPGGTSTSANNGSAASASGPPGEQTTFTGPGTSYSSSGGRR